MGMNHGTTAGYHAHRRLKEAPCADCAEAWNAYHREWRQANAEKVKGYNAKKDPGARQKATRDHRRRLTERVLGPHKVGKPCMDCGGEFPPYVMHFDHRDASTKVTEVSRMITRPNIYTEEDILAEIAKCDLVCANCHAIRTFGKRKSWSAWH